MENIGIGLLLMVVGVPTVFVILLILIYLGRGLILLVNKYAPEEVVAKKPSRAVAPAPSSVPQKTTAAIVAAVGTVTGGQGKVTKIEKI